MIIKRNPHLEGEWRTKFLLLPVWNDYQFLWLEKVKYKWESTSCGYIEWYYEPVDNQ